MRSHGRRTKPTSGTQQRELYQDSSFLPNPPLSFAQGLSNGVDSAARARTWDERAPTSFFGFLASPLCVESWRRITTTTHNKREQFGRTKQD